jgi:hypothetical protein
VSRFASIGTPCAHCDAIASGSPLPCRHCESVTETMFDVGSLDVQHDHFELCATCWRGGVQPEQSMRMRAAGWRPTFVPKVTSKPRTVADQSEMKL